MDNLKIIYVNVNELNPATYNPRKWSAKATSDLKNSIKKHGFCDPVIANCAPNRNNILIGGHFRLKIAKDLGIETVPVIYLNIPELEKEKELNLRLNKNVGDWDFELLKDFDLTQLKVVGFDSKELSSAWDGLLEVKNDKFDPEDEAKRIINPKTKLGDYYLLGNHRLLCSDSTEESSINKLLDGEKVNMVYSDPIYNIGLDYDNGLSTKSKYGGNVNDNRSESEYRELLRKTLLNALSYSKKDVHVFYYCDQNYIGMLQDLYSELGIVNKRVCLWIKNSQNPTPQIAFNKAYEPCVYGTIGNPYLAPINNFNEILNKEVGTGNEGIDNIIDLFDLWLVKRLPTSEYVHPTSKPPMLHEKALKRCSKPNDIVLDLFAGSGSTMVACEDLKRRCYMVELDPVFCDVIVKRYEKLTGNKAKKIG